MKTKFLVPILAATVVVGGLLIAHSQNASQSAGVFRRGTVLARIANKLQLTPAQRSQIKADLSAEKGTLTALFTQLHGARVQLRAAIQADNPTEASVRAAATGVAAAEADLAVERLKLHGEIYPLLTADQKLKAGVMEEKWDGFVDGVISRIGADSGK